MAAKKELDSILDLIRFELEDRVVSIDTDFISIRKKGGTARRFRMPTIVPNPSKNIDPAHFGEFVTRFSRIFENEELPLKSKEKIRSALRFYRMGRDSDLFENKFLNWWTALEYLTRTGEKGSIIEEVQTKLIPTLLLHYLQKYLNSYQNALQFCNVDGIEERTTPLELFEAIQSPDKFDTLLNQLDAVPFLKYRLKSFHRLTSDTNALGMFLKKHEEHLNWHIHRIWRIRCDIVHSAEYSLNLNLLSANLEYYLKSVLTLIFDELALKQRVLSIDEFYTRYQYGYERLHQEIKANNSNLYQLILSEAFV